MIEKTCCVTGHRDIPEDKKEFVIAELEKEIRAAVADGYTRFISGFAERCVMLLTNNDSIREVLLFPTMRPLD